MKKFLKILFYIPIFLIGLFVSLFLIIGILDKYIPDYYYYIESVEVDNKRYSLYKEYFTFGNGWVIFEHNVNYQEYKKVEVSKLSLYVYNNNPKDKFIYYYFPKDTSYENAKIELLKDKYIALRFDGMYYFLYNIVDDKKYNDRNSEEFLELDREEIHNRILEIISEK